MSAKICLADFITLQRGFDLPATERVAGDVPVVASTGVSSWHNVAKVKAPGVVIGRSGSIGGGQYIDQDFWPLNTTLYVKDFKGNNPKYVYYVLRSIDFTAFNAGAGVPTLNRNHIASLEIEQKARELQDRIVDKLDPFDAAIANCRRQIALLEEAAQRLYRESFAEGKGEKWPISALGEYMNGFAFKPSDFQLAGLPILKIREMLNGVATDTPRNDGANIPAKYRIVSGDIVFSWSATLEVVYWSGEKALLNQHLFKVTPKDDFSKPFVYHAIKNSLETFRNLAHGATMQHIQRGKLDEVTVAIPSQEILKRFDDQALPMYKALMNLKEMAHRLTEARDRLLPKLMSGEVAA